MMFGLSTQVTFYKNGQGEKARRTGFVKGHMYHCVIFSESVIRPFDCRMIFDSDVILGDKHSALVGFLDSAEASKSFEVGGSFKIWEGGFVGEGIVTQKRIDLPQNTFAST